MAFYRVNKRRLRCPTCGKKMVPAYAISGAESQFWMRCEDIHCQTFVDTYIPQDYQAQFHRDPAQQVGLFGGYGVGKTLANIKDLEKHILITPKGTSLVGAKILPQLEQTFKVEFENDFPIEFVAHINKQKNHIDFINGHRLLYRPLYDQEMIRSLNLSSARIVEASAVDFEIYVQLQARMRNIHALKFALDEEGNVCFNEDGTPRIEADWSKIVIESNPGPGWIRDEFLLTSHKIYLHHDSAADQIYHVIHPDPHKSSHIVPTKANQYLPPDFISRLEKGRPLWWIKRYLYGSFEYAEGLVYPNAVRSFVKPYTIPKYCYHLIGMDYGINDNTHILFAALDPKRNKLIVYHELVISDMNVKTIADAYKRDLHALVPVTHLYTTPVMDQRSFSKRQSHNVNKTLGDLFLDEGVLFKPAKMDKHARIMRTNTLFDLGQIEIFDTLTHLKKELLNYKFPERTLDDKKAPDKPEDKNDHGISALEFIVMELPPNLEVINYNALDELGRALVNQERQLIHRNRSYYHPLMDDPSPDYEDNPYYKSLYD